MSVPPCLRFASVDMVSQRFPDPVAKFYAAEVALALNHPEAKEIVHDTELLEREIAKKRLPERSAPRRNS